jgi:nitrite reductase/ring-hydroxylating ferredoxin subunit/putative sterol carrier protein
MNAPTPTPASTRFPFTAYPSGWFVVATSAELVPGELLALRYFGRELVAFRGESGKACVIDAHCPHLGAHLAHGGVIEGECVRCPFHGWKFDGQGKCVDIPYADRIPPKATIAAWPVLEQDEVIFVFHGQPGEQPWPLPALDRAGYTPGKLIHWRNLATHPQEVFENTVDITHIGPVHDGRGARIIGKPTREGPVMRIDLEFQASGELVGMPDQINDVHLGVTLHGLGSVVVDTHVRNADTWARQQLYATPVDETHIDIRGIVSVRATDDPVFTEELAELFYKAYVEDFAKDFPIWENKRYLTRPTLAKGDGPVGLYRRWCTQFYPSEASQTSDEPAPLRQTSTNDHARPDVPVDALRVNGRANGLRRVAADRVRGTARAVVAQARDRLPWLAAPLAALDDALGPAPTNGVERDWTEDDDWSPTDAAPRTDAPAPDAGPRHAGARIASAQEYFETLPQRFVQAAAKGVDAVYQWELSGPAGRTFHAIVRDGQAEVHDGPHPKPTVALAMGAEDYVQVVNGDLDGMTAFTSGKGKVKGSVRAAMKMRTLFPAA